VRSGFPSGRATNKKGASARKSAKRCRYAVARQLRPAARPGKKIMKFLDIAVERGQEKWTSGFPSGRATVRKGFDV
jgi:hypothetical protein